MWCAPGRNAQTLQAFFDLLGERKQLDQGGLDRHVAAATSKAIREQHPARRDLLRPVPRRPPRAARRRPGPPRRVERPRALAHAERASGSRAPAGRCSKAPVKQTIDQLAILGRSPAGQQAALPRVPAQGRAPAALPAPRPEPRAGAPRRLADLGVPVTARAVRQARPHDPPPPRRDPHRDPARPQQRAPRRPQQPHPPDQPPQLRLSLRRTR